MLFLRGTAATTPFKLEQQLRVIQQQVPTLQGVQTSWLYLVEHCGVLSSDQIGLIRHILGVEAAISSQTALQDQFIVSPRMGTISPWSSKATEILDHCGLAAGGRVERAMLVTVEGWSTLTADEQALVQAAMHDRMTQSVLPQLGSCIELFSSQQPAPVSRLADLKTLSADIGSLNTDLGLALSTDEIEYLVTNYQRLERCPTDVELMMFAQANSEHCRHKIFNAEWKIDGKAQANTLFGMIRETYKHSPENVLSAYKDNAAVMAGYSGARFYPQSADCSYRYFEEDIHILMKVETHNHPTAIAPFAGAATGSGGEIRDEGATGRGSLPKAGLCGFSVSNLRLPELLEPWEHDYGKPDRMVSALDIMIEGPIGAAAFNNEFGRPNLLGYFRCYEQSLNGVVRGYHKPIMIAGGLGNIRGEDVEKQVIPEGTPIIVLGGPAMLIGLGGGAASSVDAGSSAEQLDFASVQRDNPEMERRCQEVINRCWQMQDENPIVSIHDVGAGGVSNALPEILHDCGRGGVIELRELPNAEPGMSPLEIWCNEAQERYVLAIKIEQLDEFERICQRERCLYAVVGHATEEQHLRVHDRHFDNDPIQMPMEVLLGKPPKVKRDTQRLPLAAVTADYSAIDIADAVDRVLGQATVASKKFLITIGDRSVTGHVVRDQMVGPWQVPVADVAVTTNSFSAYSGEAMALGERTPIALYSGPKSAQMAIAEALTNLLAAPWEHTRQVKLSANWMAAANYEGEDAVLYDTVEATSELCQALDIAIPVGKDSLSMQTGWQQDGESKLVVSPVSLVVTAFVPVADVRQTWTPEIKHIDEPSCLLLVDLGAGQQRLGGSVLAQVYELTDSQVPALDSVELLKSLVLFISKLRDEGKVLSYHDRSDGGLFACVAEMAFAGRCGLDIELTTELEQALPALFAEELGCVMQVAESDLDGVLSLAKSVGLAEQVSVVARVRDDQAINCSVAGELLFSSDRAALEQRWSGVSHQIQRQRDNSECADSEFDLIEEEGLHGLLADLSFNPDEDVAAPFIATGVRPKIAILREQGVNGQVEMAAAFDRAGFQAVDVHMSDLLENRAELKDFQMLAACGGFSYGDVLGAGSGWASNILYNSKLLDQFKAFFEDKNVLGLGVCNGCQMMSQLRELIPGSAAWPRFVRNTSEQFEARLLNVKVEQSPSLLLQGMAGSQLPIVVAHGEGRMQFESEQQQIQAQPLIGLRYCDESGTASERYPLNPNGSADGATAITNEDGRFSIMMPHPERLFRTVQHSWADPSWNEDGPWLRLFRNARILF